LEKSLQKKTGDQAGVKRHLQIDVDEAEGGHNDSIGEYLEPVPQGQATEGQQQQFQSQFEQALQRVQKNKELQSINNNNQSIHNSSQSNTSNLALAPSQSSHQGKAKKFVPSSKNNKNESNSMHGGNAVAEYAIS